MADLRRVVDRIMRDYGHNVFLHRRTGTVDDGPYPRPEYANKNGKHFYEKHTVRHMHPSTVALAGTRQQQTDGVETNIDRVYWFRWNVNPAEGDRIIDHKPADGITGDPNNPPKMDPEIFTIDYAQPMRGKGGRIEYWSCGATREDEY